MKCANLLAVVALVLSIAALAAAIWRIWWTKRKLDGTKTHRIQDLTPDDLVESHRIHKEYANKPGEEVPDLYDKALCLMCGSDDLLTGPSGGASMNMMCNKCNNTWNIGFLPFGFKIEPIGITLSRVSERKKNAEQHS